MEFKLDERNYFTGRPRTSLRQNIVVTRTLTNDMIAIFWIISADVAKAQTRS